MNSLERNKLLRALQARFEQNMQRHVGLAWSDVEACLQGDSAALASLRAMELTGGDPDVIGYCEATGRFTYCDCSAESPSGRRSVCYDPEALESRKQNKPTASALGVARSMGADLLTEAQYRELQTLGEFDTKTSSWLRTPPHIRSLGGALFGDRRYGGVFVYHNGAESYYAARGFRVALEV